MTDKAGALADELLPCPFCGATSISFWQGNEIGSLERLEGPVCECGAAGPMYATRAEAITAWNARTNPSPVSREAVLEEAASVVVRFAAHGLERKSGDELEETFGTMLHDVLKLVASAIRALTPPTEPVVDTGEEGRFKAALAEDRRNVNPWHAGTSSETGE